VLVVSPASTPSYSVDVDHGIPPFEHLVVIQLASTAEHVEASMQWPGW
jgi:hypothetical protein